MKQQVNLLSADLLPRRHPLGLGQLLIAWGIFGLVLVLFSGWEGAGVWRLTDQLTDTQSQWRLLRSSNEQLQAQQAARPDSGLRAEVEALRASRSERLQLVSLLKDYQMGQAIGFSGYLDDLADHRVDGLWLSQIHLERGGRHIQLRGITRDPSHVPQFLSKLSNGASFRGHHFDGFELNEVESGLLEFAIAGPEEDG